jgi:cyclohexyl-isocyanide hydratase
MMMKRRAFTSTAMFAGLAGLLAQRLAGAETETAKKSESHDTLMQQFEAMTGFPKARIGLLVYPGMFLQDLVGPLTVFEALMDREIHLLWKKAGPIDPTGADLIPVRATTGFADCPAQLDVLFVPGGVQGTLACMQDAEVLSFLTKQGASARYVTSVCTGSLILGAAGLLKGYRATSHWTMKSVLAEFGAKPSPGRVVIDRNRITGGGVTAGIDFGLTITEKLTNQLYAQAIQLYLEYDPQPPYRAGSPERAPKQAREFIHAMLNPATLAALDIAKRAKEDLP